MTGYTKLFSSIIASTIWRADDKTRLVWITMLAMADQFGIVEASVPGLADMARVTLQECQDALQELSAPDEYSRSTERDGRRIEPSDGGWRLINHGKYRDKMSRDERREYQRLYQRSYRKQNVNSDSDKLTKFDIQKQKQKQNRTETPVRTEVPSPAAPPTPDAFTAFWSVYPKKAGKATAMEGGLHPEPEPVVERGTVGRRGRGRAPGRRRRRGVGLGVSAHQGRRDDAREPP